MNYSGRFTSQRRPRIDTTPDHVSIRKHRPDYSLLVIMSLLLVVGAVVVYAIGPSLVTRNPEQNLPDNYFSIKQLTAIGLGVIGFIVGSMLPLKHWKKLRFPLLGAAVIVAILVRTIGEEINGAHRWIQFAGFSFQAAELIKLSIVVWLAYYLAKQRKKGLMSAPATFRVLGVAALLIVFVIAGVQSDLGSAAVMLAILIVSSFAAGLPMRKLTVSALILISLVVLSIAITPYRRDRVATFFNPTADCLSEGYQACQALVTIGSGGWFGKGIGKSVQAYGYLPFPENDSIFAIVGEKFGIIGTTGVIVLFWMLFRRLFQVARQAPNDFGRFLVLAILVWLSTQMIINIGAMIGLLPLKGITLPFVSYGGTSVIFVMIAMGIVFHVSRYTTLQDNDDETDDASGGKQEGASRRPTVMRRSEGAPRIPTFRGVGR